jgi:hypothetical protein
VNAAKRAATIVIFFMFVDIYLVFMNNPRKCNEKPLKSTIKVQYLLIGGGYSIDYKALATNKATTKRPST